MAPTLSLPHSTFQKNTNVQIFFISEVSGFAVESKSQRFVPPEASSFHITCVHRKTGRKKWDLASKLSGKFTNRARRTESEITFSVSTEKTFALNVKNSVLVSNRLHSEAQTLKCF